MTENQNNTVTDVSEKGSENINEAENQQKMFTQSQLDEILAERLARERKINENLASVKQLLKTMSQRGLVKNGSYAEMAKEIISKLEGASERKEQMSGQKAEPLQDAAHATSATADADGKPYAQDNFYGGNDECERESFCQTLSKIKSKYPEKTVEKMLSGNMFECFARGKKGSPEEIFDDYYEFYTAMSQEPSEKESADFASTAFSSHSGTVSGTNLTKQQMEIAKSAGMSYREYSDLLESIPKRGQRITI